MKKTTQRVYQPGFTQELGSATILERFEFSVCKLTVSNCQTDMRNDKSRLIFRCTTAAQYQQQSKVISLKLSPQALFSLFFRIHQSAFSTLQSYAAARCYLSCKSRV